MPDYSLLSLCLSCVDSKKGFAFFKETAFCFDDLTKMEFTDEVKTRYSGLDCLALFLTLTQEESSIPTFVWVLIALAAVLILAIILGVTCYKGEKGKVTVKAYEASTIAKGVLEDLADLSFVSGHPYYRFVTRIINSCSRRCKKNKNDKKNIIPISTHDLKTKKQASTQTTISEPELFVFSTPKRSPRPSAASRKIRKNRLYPQISHLASVHSPPLFESPV